MKKRLSGKYGYKSNFNVEITKLKFEWKRKSVFITGGTGLLGSHLIERLIDLDANIIASYRSKNPKSYFFQKKFHNKINLINCDIKDRERIFDIISRYEPEIIFHLAAQTIVTTALINPLETLNTNINGTINILESSRLCKEVKAIVVASSDKAYGITDKLPYDETYKLEGKFPYDLSKACADLISQMYFSSYNLPLVITRAVNMFGPGDLNFNRIIPGTIAAIIKNKPLTIRSDGKMVREYIYIKDVVNSYISLVENIEKTKGSSFNIGSGIIMNVLDVINKIFSILNHEVPIEILNIAKSEIPNQFSSCDKITKSIGWKSTFSFEEGIRETYEWYKNEYFR